MGVPNGKGLTLADIDGLQLASNLTVLNEWCADDRLTVIGFRCL
jgi:hypothetical protein